MEKKLKIKDNIINFEDIEFDILKKKSNEMIYGKNIPDFALRPMYYILDENNNPIGTNNVIKWGRLMQLKEKIVKQENVDNYFISTVFLGIDHSYDFGNPVLWETMIFRKDKDGSKELGSDIFHDRYSTYDEAIQGHKEAVKLVKSGKIEDCEDD